jgi:hypothetical protein
VLVAHTHNPSYQEAQIRRISVQSQARQIVGKTLSQKCLTQKNADRVAQVVESLPSKCEAPNSNHSTDKKEREKSTIKIIWNHQQPQITKAILSKKSNTAGITIPALHYRAIAIKTAWYWHKNIYED